MNEDIILDIEQSSETVTDNNLSGETDFVSVVDYPEYTDTNPLPVYVIDEVIPDTASLSLTEGYYGTISDTYLDYFEGIVQKLPFDTHYLIWRSGAYAYSMAYGEDLTLSGSSFSGDCEIVRIYRESSDYNSNWYVSNFTDSVSVDTTKLFVYSDLGNYPTVERGFNTLESSAILFAIGVTFVYCICHDIFDYILQRTGR